MKHIITLLSFFFLSNALFAQNVNIPDSIFKANLVGNTAININGDGEIQVTEAQSFTGTINASWLNIADLTGVEAFTNLNELQCVGNLLTNLDVSQNTLLKTLDCSGNQLDSIDLSQNTILEHFLCNSNNFTSLDISQNTALLTIRCVFNQLTALNVSTNVAIRELTISNNPITSIDVTNIPFLTKLKCEYTQISSIDFSQNLYLSELYCRNSNLMSLDLSNCPGIFYLNARINQLSSLNLANGNNTIMADSDFDVRTNPLLSCIQVDDATWSATNWTNIDFNASFSTNCNTSLKNISNNKQDFNLYPNPTSSILNIQSSKSIEQVKLYSLEGKLLKTTMNNTVSVSELPTGTYMIQVITEEGSGKQLFIKQ